MNEQDFKKLVKKDKYQVFFFSSKVPIPYIFAVHTWIVTNNRGKINRWEAGQFYNPQPKKSWGNVYLGLFKNNPLIGMNINPFKREPRYKVRIDCLVQGDNESIAEKMIKFIEKNAKNYPYRYLKYNLLGPNSNTFPQWIINQFPEAKIKLPWNAFGKNYNNTEVRIKSD